MATSSHQRRRVTWDQVWLMLLQCEQLIQEHVRPVRRRRERGEPAALDLAQLRQQIAEVEPFDLQEYGPYLERLGVTADQFGDFCRHLQQRTLEAVDLVELVERDRLPRVGPANISA